MNRLKQVTRPYNIGLTLIRLGNKNDGGYIIPERIAKKIDICYSYGVGDDISFENDLQILNPKVAVKCFDHTISKFPVAYDSVRMSFFRQGLSFNETEKTNNFFYHLAEIEHSENNLNRLLKVDAEGAEYELFLDAAHWFQSACSCMIIEFHEIDKKVTNFISILEKLNQYFYIAHVHGNNHGGTFNYGEFTFPVTAEITF